MKRRRRAGVSIVEMLIVIAITAMLISMTGVCLHGFYRSHARLGGNLERGAAVDRLFLQLRTDAHAAKRAAIVDEASSKSLVLTAPDGTETHYAGSNGDVSRVVRQGDSIIHRDMFRLPGVEGVEWSLLEDPGSILVLTIQPCKGLSQDGVAIPMTAEAIVGLHGTGG